MDLLEVAMVFHSNMLGLRELTDLINYTRRICSVVIVVFYLGIHVARIYIRFWKAVLHEWKWVIGK